MAPEGLVAQQLRAWIDYGGSDVRLHFWRTKAGVEDFLRQLRPGQPLPG